MKIILKSNIPNFGKADEVKNVSSGYALNYLIPQGLAEPADDAKIASVKNRREADKKREVKLMNERKSTLERVNHKSVVLVHDVSSAGHLFAGVSKSDIREAVLRDLGVDLSGFRFEMKHPIKSVGEFEVPVIYDGNRSILKIIIKSK